MHSAATSSRVRSRALHPLQSSPALALLLLGLCLGVLAVPVRADEHDHRYTQGESVVLWANKVGPYHNPSEIYPYYSLPGLCPPSSGRPLLQPRPSLGLLLQGDSLADTGLSLPFRRAVQGERVCEVTLDKQDVLDTLNEAVQQHYWYELILDELPVYGMLGEFINAEEMKAELEAQQATQGDAAQVAPAAAQAQGFIYTHKSFSVHYNGDQIVQVDLTSENPRPLTLGERYSFTYSVSWQPSTAPFDERFARYDSGGADGVGAFGSHSIHWVALFNSFMFVLFICGLVLLVLNRAVKHSLINGGEGPLRAASTAAGKDPESGRLLAESGNNDTLEDGRWRLLSGDVFRAPSHLRLYAVLMGTGVQLLFLLVSALVLSLLFSWSTPSTGDSDERASATSLLTVLCLGLYALSSAAQGYVSSAVFKRHSASHTEWKRTMLVTALFYPLLLLGVVLGLNTLSLLQGSVPVLSGGTIAVLLLVWLCVSAPLSLAGTLYARSRVPTGVFPCRVNAIRRLIPSENPGAAGHGQSWRNSWWVLLAAAGVLPFGSVFVELYFVLVSFWHSSFLYVCGFLLLVLVVLLVVSACASIVATYLLLNAEDYRWAWMSFQAGAASTGYMALYVVYYFFAKSGMSGALQTACFFAYAFVALVTLALLTGAAASIATRAFVNRIYSYTKAD